MDVKSVLTGDPNRLPDSSKEEWNHFKNGALWKDIQNEIYVWLTDIMVQFTDKANEMKEFRILQGNVESLNRVLQIPEMMIGRLEEVDKVRKQETEGEDDYELGSQSE